MSKINLFLPDSLEYETVWSLQKDLQQKLIQNQINDSLIICEHEPVITFGRSSKITNILDSSNVKIIKIERGGDVSCHEPGQLIAYPIINLNNQKRDVAWYLRQLEEINILTLAEYQLKGLRIDKQTGIWINQHTKIASMGIRISRWCTMHGFALNVSNNLNTFKKINPCGFVDIKTTSINQERQLQGLPPISLVQVKETVIKYFLQVFNYESYQIQE